MSNVSRTSAPSVDNLFVDVLAEGPATAGSTRHQLTAAEQKRLLDEHNAVRAKHCLPPLRWNAHLAEQAAKWASTCYWGHWKGASPQTLQNLGIQKPTQVPCNAPPCNQLPWGENLANTTTSGPPSALFSGSTPQVMNTGVRGWIDEDRNWDCNTNQCQPGTMCGHLTQMLWQGTTDVGCAIQLCNNGFANLGSNPGQYLVCEYSPAGNYVGQRPFPQDQCTGPGCAHQPATNADVQQPPPSNETTPNFRPPQDNRTVVTSPNNTLPPPTPIADRPTSNSTPGAPTIVIRMSEEQTLLWNQLNAVQQHELGRRVAGVAPDQHAPLVQAFFDEVFPPTKQAAENVVEEQLSTVNAHPSQVPFLEQLTSAQWADLSENLLGLSNDEHPAVIQQFLHQTFPSQVDATLPSTGEIWVYPDDKPLLDRLTLAQWDALFALLDGVPRERQPAVVREFIERENPAPPSATAQNNLVPVGNDAVAVWARPNQQEFLNSLTAEQWPALVDLVRNRPRAEHPAIVERFQTQLRAAERQRGIDAANRADLVNEANTQAQAENKPAVPLENADNSERLRKAAETAAENVADAIRANNAATMQAAERVEALQEQAAALQAQADAAEAAGDNDAAIRFAGEAADARALARLASEQLLEAEERNAQMTQDEEIEPFSPSIVPVKAVSRQTVSSSAKRAAAKSAGEKAATTATATDNGDGDINWPIFAAIAVGALLLLIVVVVLSVVFSKRPNRTPATMRAAGEPF